MEHFNIFNNSYALCSNVLPVSFLRPCHKYKIATQGSGVSIISIFIFIKAHVRGLSLL